MAKKLLCERWAICTISYKAVNDRSADLDVSLCCAVCRFIEPASSVGVLHTSAQEAHASLRTMTTGRARSDMLSTLVTDLPGMSLAAVPAPHVNLHVAVSKQTQNFSTSLVTLCSASACMQVTACAPVKLQSF